MKQKFSIVVVMMIALCWGHDAFAQKAKRAKKTKAPKGRTRQTLWSRPCRC